MEVVMKKILSINLMLAAAFALLATSAFAGPSRSFIQQLGSVQANKEITIDLDVANALPNPNAAVATVLNQTDAGNLQVNVGAFGGEVRVGNKPASLSGTGSSNYVGYKVVVIPNLAVYGNLGYSNGTPGPNGTSTGATDITIGGAFTWHGPVILNLNPEYKMSSRNPSLSGSQNNVVNVNAAVLFPLSADWIIGAEYLYNSIGYDGTAAVGAITSANTLGLGVRWNASNTVTLDGLLYGNLGTSVQGGGTAPTYSDLATPAILRVNIKI
jgi:hypothetical protein